MGGRQVSATMRPAGGGPVAELVSSAGAEREDCAWEYDAASGTLRISLPRMPPAPPPPVPGAPARPAAWTVAVTWEKRSAAPAAAAVAAGAGARGAQEPAGSSGLVPAGVTGGERAAVDEPAEVEV